MSECGDILDGALKRAKEIFPAVHSVSMGTRRVSNDFYASITHDEKLGGGFIMGYGSTPEAAFQKACDHVRELLEKERAEGMCSVCAEEGIERKGDIMTGCGMMCHEHAIEWLQSEKEASEEHNGELGPCGVKS